MRHLNSIALLAVFILTACDSKDTTTTAPSPAPPPAAPVAETAPTSETPPPVAPTPGNDLSASAPVATEVAAPGGVDPSQADPLYRFRSDENGRKLSDQEALQAAASVYTRNASNSPSDDTVKPLPGLDADMKQLVEYKMVLSIPPAPGGKKYVFDKGRVIIQ